MNNQIQLVLKSSTAEMPLNDHELGIYLTPEIDGLVGLPEIRTTSGVNSGYDGGWTSAQNYDARSITIRGVIANTDVATVERLRKQLVSLAGQGKSEELTLDLVTEAGNAYTLQVRTIALEMAMQSVLSKQEFMLQLRADDPLIYDAGESAHEATLQVAKATGGFTIDFELPLAITGGSEESVVNNDGLEEVPTIVKMYGALHNPKIINQTNNEQMQIMTDLGYAEGAWHTPSEASEGTTISLANTPDSAPFSDIQLKGNTEQSGTPTPSVQVAVQTVTGENVVKICGKNLADTNSNLRSSSNGLVFTANSDGSFTMAGTATTAWANITNDFNTNLPAGEYTFSIDSVLTHRIYLHCALGDGSSTDWVINAGYTSVSRTFTSGIKTIRLDVSMMTSGQAYNETIKVQLELGSSASQFEPYQGQSYEVNLGKNLFDKDNKNILNGYFEASGGQIVANDSNRVFYIPCEPNTKYSFLQGPTSLSNHVFQIATTRELPAAGTTVYGFTDAGRQPRSGYTTEAQARYIVVRIRGGDDVSTFWDGVQIEKGSQATSYAAYFEPIELCKIGDYQDYLYKSGNKWYVHKATGKYTFTSSETVSYQSNFPRFMINFSHGQDATAGVVSQAKSSHFVVGQTASVDGTFGIAASVIYLHNNAIASADGLKTWFGNNNVSVYFALATPTDTEITNEALIAQLDDLLNLSRTYQGQTNLSTTYASGNMPAILNVSYYTEKDPDTRDELIIDSRLHTVTLNGLDIYHLIGEGSEFLMLEPGENRLSLQSDITGDNGYAVVSYKQGYLSI